MTELEIENEFGDLWTKKYWVLVKSGGHFGYSIHDEERGMMMIVERDEIVPYILDKMIKNGCKIYNSAHELPKPILRNKWDSMKEWIAFCEVAKEFKLNQKESDEVARHVGQNATREDIIEIIKNHIHRHG
jgi:hypothetical protein